MWNSLPILARNWVICLAFQHCTCNSLKPTQTRQQIAKTQNRNLSGQASLQIWGRANVSRSNKPQGPLRTKNSTALESVVFCCCRSLSLSVPFFCLFCQEKQALLSPLRSILLRPYRILSPCRNSLSVVFLVREGPLGTVFSKRCFPEWCAQRVTTIRKGRRHLNA